MKILSCGLIGSINKRDDLMLIHDQRAVEELKRHLGNPEALEHFDGFFTRAENGDIAELYAFYGFMPYTTKQLFKVDLGGSQ